MTRTKPSREQKTRADLLREYLRQQAPRYRNTRDIQEHFDGLGQSLSRREVSAAVASLRYKGDVWADYHETHPRFRINPERGRNTWARRLQWRRAAGRMAYGQWIDGARAR